MTDITGKIKMICSDIDGTLLNRAHQVTEDTRKKILELERKGIPFVLASARMPAGVDTVRRQIGNHGPIICYSGGLVYDGNGNVLQSCLIELDTALEIKQILDSGFPDICCNIYGYDKWIVDETENPWVLREEKITNLKAREGGLRTEFSCYDGVHKFLLMGEEGPIRKVETYLKKDYPGLSVAFSNENYLEVMNGAVKKSAGIRQLCNYYHIHPEEVMAFGDGYNDIDMLETVGYGYAMGNAPDAVKRCARYVTLDHDHEGLLAVLNEVFIF